MKRSRFSEEQIIGILKEQESGLCQINQARLGRSAAVKVSHAAS